MHFVCDVHVSIWPKGRQGKGRENIYSAQATHIMNVQYVFSIACMHLYGFPIKNINHCTLDAQEKIHKSEPKLGTT